MLLIHLICFYRSSLHLCVAILLESQAERHWSLGYAFWPLCSMDGLMLCMHEASFSTPLEFGVVIQVLFELLRYLSASPFWTVSFFLAPYGLMLLFYTVCQCNSTTLCIWCIKVAYCLYLCLLSSKCISDIDVLSQKQQSMSWNMYKTWAKTTQVVLELQMNFLQIFSFIYLIFFYLKCHNHEPPTPFIQVLPSNPKIITHLF